jgi:hypothetical protein
MALVQDMDLVRSWARRYVQMGYNPLPSCGNAKRPALRSRDFVRFQVHPIPHQWLDSWWAPNIQIALGVRWRLCVIDIDGDAAFDHWVSMYPLGLLTLKTWVSSAPARKFDGSLQDSFHRHFWFRLPGSLDLFPTVTLWRGPGKHQEIKVLGDSSLVVAPPSIHHLRETRYDWMTDPDHYRSPLLVPDWLVQSCSLARQKVSRPAQPRPVRSGLPLPSTFGRHYQRDDVLYALGDCKHEVAAAYGLEVARQPNSAGFYACRAIDRDDARWSCTIDPRTGVYHDWATGIKLPFFTVLMKLDPGTFPDFVTTVNKLGSWCFGGQPPCLRPK